MVSQNSSNHETAFTVSIDAKEAKTGISAYERDLTIGLMCKSNAKPEDFVRPGHIFPLIAKEGGVLERTGHTEASIDICQLAGLKPISVICEIMREDGLMARRGDKFLSEFAQKHHLKILYVSDLIEYRLQFEQLIQSLGSKNVQFLGNFVEKVQFQDHLNRIHTAFVFGKPKVPLVKFHIIKEDLDFLENESEFNGLMNAIEKLKSEGGYLVFLKTHDGKDIKGLGIGAQILKALGIEDFKLLRVSLVDESEYTALSGFNLKILERVEV